MRFGIISTGMISHEFTEALKATDGATVTAVLSRSEDSARDFIADHQLTEAASYTDLAAVYSAENVDAVYLGSPNGMHRDHALLAIGAGKHVILEKPAVWNPQQWQEVWGAAEDARVLVFEAARHIYEPAQQEILRAIESRKPVSVRLNYSQYSSRWDAVARGEEPNIFSLANGGGALVDLGVYAVYDAVLWFGAPQSVRYLPQLAPTGVDASGVLVLDYGDFSAVITTAKNARSDNPSEILFGREQLKLSSVAGIDRVVLSSDGQEETLFSSQSTNRPLAELMRYEAAFFTRMFTSCQNGGLSAEEQERYERVTELARLVNEITTEARQSAGIYFGDEQKEAGGIA